MVDAPHAVVRDQQWLRGGWLAIETLPDKLAGLAWADPPRVLSSALAQLVEQLTVNQRVAGSSPAGGAIFKGL
tara:strand:+ start:431 stop:649 length:219 start_codon:yes stop_codon:yes gene_type:complete